MSTDDVKKYFARYWKSVEADGEEEAINVIWINDSSCVVKLASPLAATKAYVELKLTETRKND